jgi:PAS domain S-box-containing protein
MIHMGEEHRKTILLVEDDSIIALSEKRALESRGYAVVTLNSGEKAVETSHQAAQIDIILMDIDLGRGIDGVEAAKRILAFRNMPIVFLSSHIEPEIVEKTEKITSYGYVVKSSSITVLDASIKMAFKLFEANQKFRETNEMFQKVLDSIPQFICWKNRRSEFLGCNKNYSDMVGLDDTRSIIGKSDWDLSWKKEETEHFLQDDEKVMSRDEPTLGILEKASDAKGRELWLETNKVPLHDDSGRVSGILVAFSDITKAKLIEEALAHEQYLLEALMNNSSDYIYFKDLESRFTRASKAHSSFLGLDSPSRMIGKTDFDFYAEEHASQAFADEREIISTGQSIRKEETNIKLGGSSSWVLTEKLPLRNRDGAIIGTFGISRDITSRKRDEERIKNLLKEEEAILKEVHHRIKNNMITINSLLNLQASTLSDANARKALEDAGNRVQSMMVLYEKLFQSTNFTTISVREYLPSLVEQIVANFPNSDSISVHETIDDFILDSKLLTHLGLIVNELLTNIMKYAFDGRDRGSIAISARLDRNRVSLIIEDDGNGMPEGINFKKSSGFGLMLVGMLTEQLGGTIGIERNEGTKIVLEFER